MRRAVEPVADADLVDIANGWGIDLSRKSFHDSAMGIFEGALFLGRLWVAEPDLGAGSRLEIDQSVNSLLRSKVINRRAR